MIEPVQRLSTWLAWLLGLAAITALMSVAATWAQDAPAPAVVGIQLADQGHRTRLVLEMTAVAPFRLEMPDIPAGTQPPARLVMVFAGAGWQTDVESPAAGLVLAIRRETTDGALRLILDLAAPVRVRSAFFLPAAGTLPTRFVLDLEPAGAGSAGMEPGVGPGPAAPSDSPATDPQTAAPALELPPVSGDPGLPLIVIDPGHGGADPGTTGRTGTLEKTLTLAMARRLRTALLETGRYRVMLTRDGDEFVSLRRRVRIARAAQADLFLSLHADSNPDRRLRGVSVYTLSERASDREAAALAARENRSDSLPGIALDPGDDATASILIDLTQRETRTESDALAGALLRRLGEDAVLLNHSHREAGLIVLKAPDVPSVLVELGHLSHREEERLLLSAEYQELLTTAMTAAIEDYFAWRRTVTGPPG